MNHSVVCNVSSLTRNCSSYTAAHTDTISWEVSQATKQETRPVKVFCPLIDSFVLAKSNMYDPPTQKKTIKSCKQAQVYLWQLFQVKER